jgi:hypothetical protein
VSNVLTHRADAAEKDHCQHYDAPGAEQKCVRCSRWYFQCAECQRFDLSADFLCRACKESAQ